MRLHQTKGLLHREGNHQQNEKRTEWKIFANDTSTKGLIFAIYKELIQLNIFKNPI